MTGARPTSRFGELIEENGLITKFSEKPKTGRAYINGGFTVFNRGLFDLLCKEPDCDLETDAYKVLAEMGEMMVYKHDGSWECMDHERDVMHLNNLWMAGDAFWKVW